MDYLNLGCGYHFHPNWTNIDFISTGEGVIAHNLRQGIPFPDASFDVVYHSHVLEHFAKEEAKQFLYECHRVLRPKGQIRVVVPDLEQIARLYLKALEEASQGSQEWAANYDWLMLEMYDQTVRNRSGGDMAVYLAQEEIPNEKFVIERIGAEGENLIKLLRPQRQQILSNLRATHSSKTPEDIAKEIGQFRLGGEVHQWMYDRYSLSSLLAKAGFTDVRVCKPNESNIPNFDDYRLDVEPSGRVRKPDSLFVEAIASRPNLWRQQFNVNRAHNFVSAPLKIIQANTVDFGGGAARAAYRLHKGLNKIGHQSLMLVNNKQSFDDTVSAVKPIHRDGDSNRKLISILQKNYIDSNRTPISNTLFSFPYPGFNLSQLDELLEADVINLHWVTQFQSPLTIKQLIGLQKPIVWTLHDMWAFTGGCHYTAGCTKYTSDCIDCPQLKEDPHNLAAAILADKIASLADAHLTIVTPSHWLAECAKQSQLFKHQRIEVIPNSLETDVFVPVDKAKARELLRLEANIFTLLIGADNGNERRKGFMDLLNALRLCLKSNQFQNMAQQNKVQLLCFGLPNEELKSLNIPLKSFGRVDSDEILKLIYSAADIFVLPSLEDNLPNTMLEAMSCGTPVVAYDVGGIPDLVKEGVTGRLVRLEDTSHLAEVILECSSSPGDLQKMGKQCRQLIEAEYGLESQAKRYLELYQDLLGKRDFASPVEQVGILSNGNDSKRSNHLNPQTISVAVPLETMFATLDNPTFERASLKAALMEMELMRSLPTHTDSQEPPQPAQAKLQKVRTQLKSSQEKIQELQAEVEAMKTSKFWKLRSLWFKLKGLVGLRQD
ncbi:MAG: glycosyltransferase [Oculatellaceae cyanobacterium bins.114]|nr:glycosyltransferase [Oculatellaceae cyanobacterium bins.114]